MGYLCDFCGEQRSIIYCRSDAASLCLSCDRNVHSANALSKRHSRTLVCERCNSQPAFIRCIEEKLQKLSSIWSFLLDFPSVGDSTCEQGMGSMSITDNRPMDCQGPHGKNNVQDASFLGEASNVHNVEMDKSTVWMESLNHILDPRLQNVIRQLVLLALLCPRGLHWLGGNMKRVCLPGAKEKETAVCEDDDFYDVFNMDEVDLSIENYEELFGAALDNPQLFGNDGIDEIFGTKDMSGSNCQGAYAAEGSSIGGTNVMQPACSNAASADSVLSCKTDPNLYFARQAHSSLSFSGLTGESSAGDYQDCGVSSKPMMGEPPWYPPGTESSMPSASRNDAVMRYKEKKKARKFEKKVRYASRKARADVRRRVKGRFVKAGDAYDYDPLSPSQSC
ncbi:UNVERIFIED_CONTAM: Zinc finger protein CONSTANS-LIKE 9 [Sesamum angustifolium]|uniref:Zinc finger protein CONSTANS-LIKE 9 n=1 Tax=Sesamum angustifolium TaxID=2727405 RepID=A0AAW2PH50_9LAMI